MKLRSTPFELSGRKIDGEPFDIESLRGKIVLVDHWATTCAGCIAAMPRIHDIYLRYQDLGFEVLLVNYDGPSRLSKVERIEKELGLTWMTYAGNFDLWDNTISVKYGYGGFPQYMLLNRDGTIRAGTGAIDMGRNLEALLNEMLEEEATLTGEEFIPPLSSS